MTMHSFPGIIAETFDKIYRRKSKAFAGMEL